MQELFKRSSYQSGFLISGLSLERGSIKTKHLPKFQLLLARVAQHTRQETLSGPRTIYGDHWHRQQDYNSPLFSPCMHSVACYCTQMPLRCVENFLFVVLMSNEMFSWCAKTVAFFVRSSLQRHQTFCTWAPVSSRTWLVLALLLM